MAIAKKSTKKPRPSAKKGRAKASTKVKSKRAAKKTVRPGLSADERRRLLKPRAEYDDVIERAVRVWGTQRTVKVPALTGARLASLLKRAQTAASREEVMRQRFESKLRPLQDARLIAEDAAYRALLDLNAAVKVFARNDPTVLEAFAFLAEYLTSARGTGDTPEGGDGGAPPS
jgi:hypothetical protein